MTRIAPRFLVVVFLLFIGAGLALAASAKDVRQSFRLVADVSLSRELIVPSVVSISLPPEVSRSQVFGVYSTSEETFLPYEVRRQASRAVPVRVSSSGGMGTAPLGALVDTNHATVVDFPLPETSGAAGVVTLQYVFDAPITSNSLQMTLSEYVVRPTAVSIRAEIDGVTRTIVSRVQPSANSVSFPAFTSRVWSVTLEYAQPLRFTELSFVNTNIVEETASLVFLARPSSEYKLYYDPEVILSQETGERPQFGGEGAVPGTLVNRVANVLYQAADSDHDGIKDLSDNCPRVANEDQEDVDGNGRGDVCDDFDHDGVENVMDNCPDTPNRNQADIDRDGAGDMCDNEESRFTEKYPWIVWVGLAFASLVFAGLFFVALRRAAGEPR